VNFRLSMTHLLLHKTLTRCLRNRVQLIPFDLRHLRVIIYDIREPEWAPRLRKSISDYLRNAMKEPEKSIPHPFRLLEDVERAPSRGGRRAST
jgi:hypothetical protein